MLPVLHRRQHLALGGLLVALALHQNVEGVPLLIHRPPTEYRKAI
jgi:hypothetical protein